jgi:predicted peptidase
VRKALVVCLLIAACSSPVDTETFLQGSFPLDRSLRSIEAPAEELRHLLWFPAGYGNGSQHPLVVFLHGSGDDDYDSQWVLSYGLPSVLAQGIQPDTFDAVVLIPQAGQGTAWWSPRQPEAVEALIEDVVDRYDIDPAAISVTGLSMGGFGTWHMVARFPARFARAASISGSGFGSVAIPDDVDPCAIRVPIRSIHGTDDPIALPDLVVEAVDTINQRCDAGHEVEFLQSEGHFSTFERIYRDEPFLDWLLKG